MNRFSATFQRLGGPGAVTWWAFGVSTADRLLAVSVQPVNVEAPVSARIAATLLAQLAMFVPLVLLRFTLLKDPYKPRPWVALAGFSIADVVRALAVDQLLHHLGGLPLMPELRVFSGFLPTLIPLIVTAYVVNTVRERKRDLNSLLEIRDQLEASRARAEFVVEQRNEELVERVRAVMDAEVATLSAQQPAKVVAQLQRTATDVVRPLSHQLATSFAESEIPAPLIAPTQAGWRQIVGETFMDKPLRPGLTTLLVSGVWISAIAVYAPVRIALATTLILIPVFLAAANLILLHLLPRIQPLARILVVLGSNVIVGVLIGLILQFLSGAWPSATTIALAASFYVVVVGAGMSIVGGVLAARTTVLDETAVAVEELREQVVRTRQLMWYHQRALARALHGPVQSAVTAAALRMADSAQENAFSPELITSVQKDMVAVLDVLQDPRSEVTALDASLARIAGIWEGVCAVTSSVDDTADQRISADPVARAILIDIVTEAVSNAVRHGRAQAVSIVVKQQDNLIDVTVVDDGAHSLTPGGEGLGSTLLDECTKDWSLTQTESGHTLRALLPAIPSSELE